MTSFWLIVGKYDVDAVKRVTINGYVPRMTATEALLNSRDQVVVDAIRGCGSARPVKSSEEGYAQWILGTIQHVIWHSKQRTSSRAIVVPVKQEG